MLIKTRETNKSGKVLPNLREKTNKLLMIRSFVFYEAAKCLLMFRHCMWQCLFPGIPSDASGELN